MFKIMVFGKRRSGMSREDLIRAYENDHLKLADRLIGDGTIPPMLQYRRNYICHDDPLNIGNIEFDVVTEAVFSDRASFEANRSGLSEPEIALALMEDMQKFLDLSDLRYLVVQEFSGGGGAAT